MHWTDSVFVWRLSCGKNWRNLSLIFLTLFTTLVVHNFIWSYRLARRPRVTARNVCYASVNCSFRQQRSVNIACMELCHVWQIAFSPWLEVGRWALDVSGTVGFSYDSWAFCYNSYRNKLCRQLAIIKFLTTPYMCRYTTSWNTNARKLTLTSNKRVGK